MWVRRCGDGQHWRLLLLMIMMKTAVTSAVNEHSVALLLGETRVLIAARDESVTVRCPAGVDDELHWVKLTPAAAADDDDDDNDERWVEVSRRRRLVLDAGVQDRDGVYLCVVTNASSSTPSARLAANVTVISPYIAEFSGSSSDKTVSVVRGNTAIIDCHVPASVPSAPVISYLRDGHPFTLTSRHLILPSGALLISRVRRRDEAVYGCVAVNPVTHVQRTSPTSVHLRLANAAERRFVRKPASHVRAVTGDRATLECVAEGGRPAPRLTWRRLSGEPLHASRHNVILGNLYLGSVEAADADTYICEARFADDAVLTATSRLHVITLPEITEPPADMEVTAGDTLHLRCVISRSLRPYTTVWWLHNAVPVTGSITDDGLLLRNASRDAAGTYQCFVSNVAGTVSAAATVRVTDQRSSVTDPPQHNHWRGQRQSDVQNIAPEGSKSLQLPASLASSPSSNSVDDAINITKVALRDGLERIPPSRPNVTRTSDTSVLVEWSILTSSNSLPVVLFKVQYQQLKPRKRWKTADDEIPATILQFHVHDLKPDTTYRFRVMALYSDDDSLQGPAQKFTLQSVGDQSLVTAPFIVELSPESEHAVSLTWQYNPPHPEDRVPIDGFLIYFKQYDEPDDEYQNETVADVMARGTVISNLTADTLYSFYIKCFNSRGSSLPSNIVVTQTLGGTVEPVVLPFDRSTTVEPVFHRINSRTVLPLDRSTAVTYSRGWTTEETHELLYVVLSVVFGSSLLTLIAVMFVCACRQRQRQRILAARRGETKFHDPSRAIYLNSVPRRSKAHQGSGFLLGNIGSTAGNRLANGYLQDHASGSWRNSALSGRQPEMDVRETEKLKPAADQQQQVLVDNTADSQVSHEVPDADCDLQLTGEPTVHLSDKSETAVDANDPGVIERPREIAPSTSQQHLQRSLRGHSETGSRQSSSLNRDRRTSPDHIPRIHECWSLEPVRRAHRDRASHRVGGELSSDVSSLDSLPASSRPPLAAPSELPTARHRMKDSAQVNVPETVADCSPAARTRESLRSSADILPSSAEVTVQPDLRT